MTDVPSKLDPVVYLETTAESYNNIIKLIERDKKQKDYYHSRYREKNGTDSKARPLIPPIKVKIVSQEAVVKM